VAVEAVGADKDDVGRASEPVRPRRHRWGLRGPRSEAAKSTADESWSWSLQVSDWPIGKASYDLTADQAINAVLGLDKYYERAMTGLSKAEDQEAVRGSDQAQAQGQ
jgi:hypothetical protein